MTGVGSGPGAPVLRPGCPQAALAAARAAPCGVRPRRSTSGGSAAHQVRRGQPGPARLPGALGTAVKTPLLAITYAVKAPIQPVPFAIQAPVDTLTTPLHAVRNPVPANLLMLGFIDTPLAIEGYHRFTGTPRDDIRAARHRPARAVEAAVGAHLGPAALGERYEACLVPEGVDRKSISPRSICPPCCSQRS